MSLLAVFLASLVGSIHCVGMCGGFVLCFSSGGTSSRIKNNLTPHILYHLGRLCSYSILGGIAGLLGELFDAVAESAVGFEKLAALITGVMLIFWGIQSLLELKSSLSDRLVGIGAGRIESFFSKVLGKPYGENLGKNLSANWSYRALLIGLMSGLLPCGWLYAFVAVAVASGSMLNGMLTMAVFWLGTLPALAAVGACSHLLSATIRKFLPKFSALLIILAGIFSVMSHLGYSPFYRGHGHHHHHALQ